MELVYTPKAKNDLLQIKERIIENFADEELARKTIKKVTAKIKKLTIFPYLGKSLSDVTGVPTEYRSLFCERNHVFYRVDKNRIYVIRVLHEKQDYMRILFGISETEEE